MTYVIKGRYSKTGITEEIEWCNTEEEAEYLAGEYQLSFGPDWSVWIERTQ